MKCIILLNQKGGVAKSTSTYNLAAAKALSGKTVLMIDLDPQASLTIMTGIEPGEQRLEGHSTCDLFDQKKDPYDAIFKVNASGLDNLYIIPSDIDLAEKEKDLILKIHSEVKLKKAIRKMAEDFDYIFIDCPPQLGQLSINALVAADEVIIPCKTDYVSYRGLRALLETIIQIKEEDLNENLQVKGIIGTFYEERVTDQRTILDMISEKASIIGTVRKSADISRNVVNGLPVVLAMKTSKTAKEYIDIADQL
ncbi:MAG: AAA family ATPase [Eubacteriales bacterium]|nr:AAA family ATPase [Eubacteriales bacterium]